MSVTEKKDQLPLSIQFFLETTIYNEKGSSFTFLGFHSEPFIMYLVLCYELKKIFIEFSDNFQSTMEKM